MKVANNSAIKEYNELLSGAFRFEDEWHSYVLRCCPNRPQDRESLALDVCSNLLMLARGKLSEKISVIPSHDEMIKYFCTWATLLIFNSHLKSIYTYKCYFHSTKKS